MALDKEIEPLGPDAELGLGRVVGRMNDTTFVAVEMLDENGEYCIGIYELGAWRHPPPDIVAELRKQASRPPIATYRNCRKRRA